MLEVEEYTREGPVIDGKQHDYHHYQTGWHCWCGATAVQRWSETEGWHLWCYECEAIIQTLIHEREVAKRRHAEAIAEDLLPEEELTDAKNGGSVDIERGKSYLRGG